MTMPNDQVFDCCRVCGPENGAPACEHWRAFDHQYIAAHCLWGLIRLALEVRAELIRGGRPNDDDVVASIVLLRVGLAKPRSTYVPMGIADSEVEELIRAAAVWRGAADGRQRTAA